MKRFIYLAVGALALTACDNIDSDNRYIQLPATEADRIVLMEEFTGQLCVNCPAGHVVIEKLEEQYGDRFIAVSIHSGGAAFSISEESFPGVGLANSDGEAIATSFGVNSWPSASVDGGSVSFYNNWATDVYNAMQEPAGCRIDLDASYDQATGQIAVTANVANTASTSISANVHLWIVEDDIVGIQLDEKGNTMDDYVHNNVFRTWMTTQQGTAVSLDAAGAAAVPVTAIMQCKDTWNAANLSVVAFVTASGSKTVLNAARAHLAD